MSVTNLENKKILPITPNILLSFLREHQVSFKLFKHRPLISVEDSKNIQALVFPSNRYSVHIKNLYLRDKKKNNYLVTCEQDKKIDLKCLKEKIKSDRLSFGSPKRLFQNLGVLPGAVSPFCMLNGIKNKVDFYCDFNLKGYKKIFLHPFTYYETVYMNLDDLEKFLSKYNVFINWIDL